MNGENWLRLIDEPVEFEKPKENYWPFLEDSIRIFGSIIRDIEWGWLFLRWVWVDLVMVFNGLKASKILQHFFKLNKSIKMRWNQQPLFKLLCMDVKHNNLSRLTSYYFEAEGQQADAKTWIKIKRKTWHLGPVHTMDHVVVPGRCKSVDWLLNSSWDNFSLH